MKFEVDLDGSFKRALNQLGAKHRMTSAQVVNQLLLDVAKGAFMSTPFAAVPQGVPPAPAISIRDKLRQPVADRKFGTTGRIAQTKAEGLAGRTSKAGKFIRHSKNRQLQVIHLIVNALRGKSGARGLYGEDMLRYAGKVVRSRTGGVGSLKISFLPAIRALMPLAKFKFSWSALARGIKSWPGSVGWGSTVPARPGVSPEAVFIVRRTSKKHVRDSLINHILSGAVSDSIAKKRASVLDRASKIQDPAIAAFNRVR